MATKSLVRIASETDIVTARQEGRALAAQIGFQGTDLTVVATAISELARNIVSYAGDGEVALSEVQSGGRRGIEVAAIDRGPGIANLTQAVLDGFSTGGGLGLGLPGTRRLMDDFDIQSKLGHGTTVTVRKWLK